MYSQFFVLSLRGDTLIFKDCKSHVPYITQCGLTARYTLSPQLIANNGIYPLNLII